MRLKFKKLNPAAVLPHKAHATDAGMDLTCTSVQFSERDQVYVYGTGLAMEIPEGYVGLIFSRSSVFKTGEVLSNCVGVIDSGYRGEVFGKFYQVTNLRNCYNVGDRFAQLIVMPIPDIETEWAEELSDTDRGEGGYGSSGK